MLLLGYYTRAPGDLLKSKESEEKKKKKNAVFPPSVDCVFIHQSSARVALIPAVITEGIATETVPGQNLPIEPITGLVKLCCAGVSQ